MKEYINTLLQELNSISRMAVIENASVTEKMLVNYSQILKYRWNEERKEVTAEKEMSIVLKCCELFKLKHNGILNYQYTEMSETKTIFIPHHTMVTCVKHVLKVLEGMTKAFDLQIEVSENKGMTWIQFLFVGQIDFDSVLKQVSLCGEEQKYEQFNEAVSRWQERFGEGSFKLIVHTINKGQLEMSFGCK